MNFLFRPTLLALLPLSLSGLISLSAQTPAPTATVDPQAPISLVRYPDPIRVACVGDSITAGNGTSNPKKAAYPAQLQEMLGDKWVVKNFGASGRTLLQNGTNPYQKTNFFRDAIAFNPDVVIIMLGANDSKPKNWVHKEDFAPDYRNLIGKFKALPTNSRIFICLPVPASGVGNYGITEPILQEEIPMIQEVAKSENVGLIDMHAALFGHDDVYADRVHPKDAGAFLIAKTAYKALTGTNFPSDFAPAK